MANEDEKWFNMLIGKEQIANLDEFSLQVARYFGDQARTNQNELVKKLNNNQTKEEYARGLDKVLGKLRAEGLIDGADTTPADLRPSILGRLSQQLQELVIGIADRIDPALADDGDTMESNQDLYELLINGEVQVSIQVSIDSANTDMATIIARFSEAWLSNPDNRKTAQHGVVIMAEGEAIIEGKIIDGELSGVVENYSRLALSKQWLILGKVDGAD